VNRRLFAAVAGLALSVVMSGCDARLWFICSLGVCGEQFDISAPETPREVRATTRSHQVILTWAPNNDDVDRYRIYRSTTHTQPAGWSGLVDAPTERPVEMSFIDRDLVNDTAYHYWLTAVDSSDNESLPSAEVEATPRLGSAPDAPQHLVATGGEAAIDLSWSASEDADIYRVYRADPGDQTRVQIASGSSTTYTDRDFIPGLEYSYVVTAVDVDHQESAFSNEASILAPGSAAPQFILKWGLGSDTSSPVDVTVGPQGDVYVADSELRRVQRFTPTGALVRTFGLDGEPCAGGLAEPSGVAVGPSGTVYVADTGPECIQMFNADGSPAGSFGGTGTEDGDFRDATRVAVDQAGNVYVTDAAEDTIQKFTSSGTFLELFTPDDLPSSPVAFDTPFGIVLDTAGTMWVSSYSFGRIWEVDSDGNSTASFGGAHGAGSALGEMRTPQGVALDRGSRLYVADAGNDRIQGFDLDGRFSTRFGRRGSGDGEFVDPRGVAADCHGDVYVADTGNHRIQKFAHTGGTSPCGQGLLGDDRLFAVTRAAATPAKRKFRLSFTATAGRRGTVTGTTERRARQRGRFALSGRRTDGLGQLARRFRSGSWYALLDIRAGRAIRARGTLLATSRRHPKERLCLAFRTTLTPGAKARIRGTFKTLGGTRGAGGLRLAGRYDQRVDGRRSWVLRGASDVGRRAREGLPRSCRRVATAFRLG
jgi:DNA-binding beta-propeller fold protein YncE